MTKPNDHPSSTFLSCLALPLGLLSPLPAPPARGVSGPTQEQLLSLGGDGLESAVGGMPALGDIDADGDLDLWCGGQLFMNNGLGHFEDVTRTHLPETVLTYPVRARFGDIDGDGDLDLLQASNGSNQLYINDGLGFFADESSLRWATGTL